MDVGTWLIGLGLGQYEAVFRESEIDADVLTELTDQHLKDLGIALGHRLKLLRAIRQLAGEAAVKASEQPKPEDMGDLLRAFQRAVAAAVTRFDGHVAKWTGDGASVYFGYPRAHEDDAERATRASIALVEDVGRLRRERGVAL